MSQLEASVTALQELGLTLSEAKIYLSLLTKSPANGNQISKDSGVPSAKVYENLERLKQQGLITMLETNAYVPLPLSDFLSERESRLKEVGKVLKDSIQKRKHAVQGELLWHGKGYEALITRAQQMLVTAQHHVLMSAWVAECYRLLDPLKEALERGVSVSIICFGSLDACESLLKDLGESAKLHLFVHASLTTTQLRHGGEANIVIDDTMTLVMDGSSGDAWTGVWTANTAMARTVANYIRHDIFINKLYFNMGDALRERYGQGLEQLLTVTKGGLELAKEGQ